MSPQWEQGEALEKIFNDLTDEEKKLVLAYGIVAGALIVVRHRTQIVRTRPLA